VADAEVDGEVDIEGDWATVDTDADVETLATAVDVVEVSLHVPVVTSRVHPVEQMIGMHLGFVCGQVILKLEQVVAGEGKQKVS
jgi:hypothetical protein